MIINADKQIEAMLTEYEEFMVTLPSVTAIPIPTFPTTASITTATSSTTLSSKAPVLPKGFQTASRPEGLACCPPSPRASSAPPVPHVLETPRAPQAPHAL